jgi:phage-related protein
MKKDVVFYQEPSGNEPVRKWLKGLDKETRLIIGEDLKRVQYRWPLGMPLVRGFGSGLWEVRSTLTNRIARIFFILHNDQIVLLHSIIKKTEETPSQDLDLTKKRAENIRSSSHEKKKRT